VIRDTFVKAQTSTVTYTRAREYLNLDSKAKVYLQYRRRKAWLDGWRFTLVAADDRGLEVSDVNAVLKCCRHCRLGMGEIAFDFPEDALVDLDFVRQHALFGKSQPRRNHSRPDILWFGTRRSAKFVRCYHKHELNVFRVELELHSSFLKTQQIVRASELFQLAAVLPGQIRFVRLKRVALLNYLEQHFGARSSHRMMAALKTHSCIHDALRYLRREGVRNVHRYLKPIWPTACLETALRRWSRNWL